MTEPAALQKLLTWLSPAFPVGAFAWSAGLETAIAERIVTDSISLQTWLLGIIDHGGIRTDAIVLAEAHRVIARGRTKDLQTLADLCLALNPAAERLAETTITGENFKIAAQAWPSDILDQLPDPCPYPIAVGAISAAQNIGLAETLLAYLTVTIHGQISVAVRLVPLGQTDGLRVMAGLEPAIARLAEWANVATLADIGGIAYAADIAQMRHEALEPRIFRS